MRHISRCGRDVCFNAERAENATLWDVEGNEVIDFASGIGGTEFRASSSEGDRGD